MELLGDSQQAREMCVVLEKVGRRESRRRKRGREECKERRLRGSEQSRNRRTKRRRMRVGRAGGGRGREECSEGRLGRKGSSRNRRK